MSENERFETFLLADLDLKSISMHIFFVQDGNHGLQAQLPYINCLQDDEPSYHISIDSIILNTFHGLVEFFTATMELNKYVLDHSLVSYIKLNSKDFVFIPFGISVG